ncbi:MAG: type I DNA topoisomerase [Flavobacteriales bacterium]|nr:type I DNA topoisomerase [Flavobacteriales bacterium]
MAKKKASGSGDLVIVESPAKAKTIEKYLGEGYTVLSSYGHVRDLPERDLSVDVENGFEPTYIIPDDKKDRLSALKREADKAAIVWLATDEDREGEAISWHLKEALKLPADKVRRITFNEITKPAILKAIENPRQIDVHLVDAQQARRVLDRLVGYELSPILWRKVKPSLSAGRVQSVAVRLIVEREREILGFAEKSAFRITALLITGSPGSGTGATVKAELPKRFATEAEAMAFLQGCVGATFTVNAVEKKPGKRTPAAPFTTSTLQQEASRKLGFGVDRTMRIAQGLYEQGHITYMRTDSVNLSEQAIAAAEAAITAQYGARYCKTRRYQSKSKGAQEAHEAIRPTDFNVGSAGADRDAERLYDLIRKRTFASQMADAELEKTVVNIAISSRPGEDLVAQGEVILFDGFLKVYMEGRDDEGDTEEQEGLLPDMKQGERLGLQEMTATQRFERPAPRYTEASLVKKLEELGIGRPSTYAPTISTVQKRGYVVKENRDGTPRPYRILTLAGDAISDRTAMENVGAEKQKLFPTDIGMVVNDFLVEHFPTIVDLNFTAYVEGEFDQIAEGTMNWRQMLKEFYAPFHKTIGTVSETAERATGARELGLDPASGRKVHARIGRFGPMIQIGEADDEEKPKFASLRKDQSIGTITLQEALDLFKLPRTLGERDGEVCSVGIGRFGPYVRLGSTYASLTAEDDPLEITLQRAIELIDLKKAASATRDLGEYKGEMIVAGRGRFGPYVKFGKTYANIPKTEDPAAVTLERAIELVEAKLAGARQNVLKEFEGSVIQVLDGRYGPYITDGSKNANVPKGTEPEDVTLEQATELLAAAPEKKGGGRRGTARGAAAKKAPAKKAAAKKTARKRS